MLAQPTAQLDPPQMLYALSLRPSTHYCGSTERDVTCGENIGDKSGHFRQIAKVARGWIITKFPGQQLSLVGKCLLASGHRGRLELGGLA